MSARSSCQQMESVVLTTPARATLSATARAASSAAFFGLASSSNSRSMSSSSIAKDDDSFGSAEEEKYEGEEGASVAAVAPNDADEPAGDPPPTEEDAEGEEAEEEEVEVEVEVEEDEDEEEEAEVPRVRRMARKPASCSAVQRSSSSRSGAKTTVQGMSAPSRRRQRSTGKSSSTHATAAKVPTMRSRSCVDDRVKFCTTSCGGWSFVLWAGWGGERKHH